MLSSLMLCEMQLMFYSKTECIVSLEVVGPLFRWAAILTVRYSNNVRVRVTLLCC